MQEQTSKVRAAAKRKEKIANMRRFFRVMFSRRIVIVGAVGTIFFVLVALLAPLIAPYDPNEILKDGVLQPFSQIHPLGTDYLGRDLLLRTPGTSRRFWPRGPETRMAMKILIPSLVIFGAGVILTAAGIFLFPDYFDLVRQARLSP